MPHLNHYDVDVRVLVLAENREEAEERVMYRLQPPKDSDERIEKVEIVGYPDRD